MNEFVRVVRRFLGEDVHVLVSIVDRSLVIMESVRIGIVRQQIVCGALRACSLVMCRRLVKAVVQPAHTVIRHNLLNNVLLHYLLSFE